MKLSGETICGACRSLTRSDMTSGSKPIVPPRCNAGPWGAAGDNARVAYWPNPTVVERFFEDTAFHRQMTTDRESTGKRPYTLDDMREAVAINRHSIESGQAGRHVNPGALPVAERRERGTMILVAPKAAGRGSRPTNLQKLHGQIPQGSSKGGEGRGQRDRSQRSSPPSLCSPTSALAPRWPACCAFGCCRFERLPRSWQWRLGLC